MPTKPKYAKTLREIAEDDIASYPCGVCKQEFRSRRELRTHSHGEVGTVGHP